MDSNRNARKILLEFKRVKIPGQESCKSHQLLLRGQEENG